MKTVLENLRDAIYSPGEIEELSDNDWQQFVENCVVALTTGGDGSRLRAVSAGQPVQKNVLHLPDGDTMIERTIRMYRDAGFQDFLALVFYQAQSIIDVLGDGSHLSVNIRYSHDPEHPVGRGGAIRNALENGSIPRSKSLIVHNPDDQIINYNGSFPRHIVAGHLAGVRKGMIATVVVVEGTSYAYTGMEIHRGVVTQTEIYPLIPIPTHTGVTVLSHAAYDYFIELFDMAKKIDFESILFPLLAQEGRLYSFTIPSECWLPVNDPKALDKLIEIIKDNQM